MFKHHPANQGPLCETLPHPERGKQLMTELIDAIKTGVPDALAEVKTLGRTLNKRRTDVLAAAKSWAASAELGLGCYATATTADGTALAT